MIAVTTHSLVKRLDEMSQDAVYKSDMTANFRLHGKSPHMVVAVHGGPGGIGEARPFAEELAKKFGVVEPFLMAKTFEGQVLELKSVVEDKAMTPVILVGHSYGAMISYVFAARYPELVSKLVMVSSGLLEAVGAEGIAETRLSRLSYEQKERLETERAIYKSSKGKTKARAFVELFTLTKEADTYDAITHKSDLAIIRPGLYDSVWEGVQPLRDSGDLVAYGTDIKCPVVAIHGDYDPRPAASVRLSLEKHVKDLKFITLEKCGHYPWYEKQARNNFYDALFAAVG